ncbi:TPA: hypothetical protein LTW47_002667 [Enterobacter hormaechei]|nr:hypothetical protein [Enterobacter hormaechei]HBL8835884.1 hypothetical protein [Enterobacter hormaechei]HBL9036086.1 hypothetical protein [Enterobacter hormaechei]HBL9109103.1 hypothetical protein [Enterobacter hormaechei]
MTAALPFGGGPTALLLQIDFPFWQFASHVFGLSQRDDSGRMSHLW